MVRYFQKKSERLQKVLNIRSNVALEEGEAG